MKFKQKKITCDKKLTITYTYYLNLNTFHSRTSPFDLIFTNNWMQSIVIMNTELLSMKVPATMKYQSEILFS